MKRKKILALFLLFLIIGFAQTAFSEDFTLRVPVKLSNLHSELTGVQVNCLIFVSELGVANSRVSRAKTLDISSGNVDTIVELKFDPPVNVEPDRVDSYSCNMTFRKGNVSSTPLPPENSNCINNWTTYAYKCGAPGTIVRRQITGSIP